MGSGLSDIANGVSAVKNLFSPQVDPNAQVPGTGSTAAQLQTDYPTLTSDDLKGMGAKTSPSALQQGIGSGIASGFQSLDQSRQNINRSARPTNFSAPAPASVNGYGVPQPMQVPTLFTLGNTPRSGFFGG